jgi:hypothetical protein
MRYRLGIGVLMAHALVFAVIIDRIAVVVGNSIVKDSDIDRDIRVTSFLNNQPLDFSNASRKKAASRLIDQIFIKHEIQIADYATATPQDAERQLAGLKLQRFRTHAAYRQALARYGLTDLELRTQFQWQLSVLRFIDVRFKPAVLISDEDVENYYKSHTAALRREYPGKSLDDIREQIRDTLTGEKVNQMFFSWLDDQRKNNKIKYLEESLA